jgi:hypothetical protein
MQQRQQHHPAQPAAAHARTDACPLRPFRCCQVRPLNDRERDAGFRNCISFDEQTKQVVLMVSLQHCATEMQQQCWRGRAAHPTTGSLHTPRTLLPVASLTTPMQCCPACSCTAETQQRTQAHPLHPACMHSQPARPRPAANLFPCICPTHSHALQAVDKNTLMQLRGNSAKGYAFDRRYGPEHNSDSIYDECVTHMVDNLFKASCTATATAATAVTAACSSTLKGVGSCFVPVHVLCAVVALRSPGQSRHSSMQLVLTGSHVSLWLCMRVMSIHAGLQCDRAGLRSDRVRQDPHHVWRHRHPRHP